MPPQTLPNFFIAGAPKCGTSALYAYLSRHPDVFMPWVKEPDFFGSDLAYVSKRLTAEEYLGLFSPGAEKKRVGEASVSYFYSRRAAEEIRAFNPSAKIVLSLRNPVELMAALHSEHVFTGNETIESFETALGEEARRRAGASSAPAANPRESVYYRYIADFFPHVERFFNCFGAENVKVLIFDDFKKDAQAVYRSVLEFLGVDPDHRISATPVNPNKRYRSRWLRDFIWHPPWPVRLLAKSLFPSQKTRAALSGALHHLNSRVVPRPPLPEALVKSLAMEMKPSIERLSRLIGRDLTFWCRSTGGGVD